MGGQITRERLDPRSIHEGVQPPSDTGTVRYRERYRSIPGAVPFDTGSGTVRYRERYRSIPGAVPFDTGSGTGPDIVTSSDPDVGVSFRASIRYSMEAQKDTPTSGSELVTISGPGTAPGIERYRSRYRTVPGPDSGPDHFKIRIGKEAGQMGLTATPTPTENGGTSL